MSPHDDIQSKDDPWALLGLEVDATDAQIREAYLRGVREHPPDRSPEQFERIRDAYEELRDPRRRCQRMILSADPQMPLTSLLGDDNAGRRFVGPKVWLAALRGK